MATLLLGAAGTVLGGGFGGTILGLSGGVIGGMIGSTIGSMVDSWIIAGLQPGQKYEGTKLDSTRVTSSTEGAVIPRVFGTVRIGGNIIWGTDFRMEVNTKTQGGKGGAGGKVTTTEYLYYASFAVAICEGKITGIGRIWADGDLLDMSGVTWRWYPGDEEQEPDPFIAATMGADATPAYRGTAYVVMEDLALEDFGNRIPQLTFEVFKPIADTDTAEGMIRAVTLIPGTGEFALSTQVVSVGSDYANSNALEGVADVSVSLDHLAAALPSLESVSVVVAWFGDDLRAGHCAIKPGVEVSSRSSSPISWSVDGVARSDAHLVSQIDGSPAFGGTPSDQTMVELITELKARGYKVTLYPFVLMDIPSGNVLANPYSDGAGDIGQPEFPWRGRITCSPAADYAGTVDKTVAAAMQVAAFFDGTWGYRRMILHYAELCASAGGVDAFLIGSELRGLTQVRSSETAFPAVEQLRTLAADVRAVLGSGTALSYAADWTEYFGHHPQDGSGNVFFHLDPLWSHSDIDFVGIDYYMPLSDWRSGVDHIDALGGAPTPYQQAYLRGNVAGGEGFEWFYASDNDRADQIRTDITDGDAAKPWVFRYKDLWNWWGQQHFNRSGGVEAAAATAWVPQGKPIIFTEVGCPAIDRGANQPNVFVDAKSSESAAPYFSRGWRDDAMQRAYLEAVFGFFAESANNPESSVYGGPMVDIGASAAWCWDARPYPYFPAFSDVWTDAENWRLGHWLNGRIGAGSLAAVVRSLALQTGISDDQIDVSDLSGSLDGYVISAVESPKTSIAMLARHFGFDACETEGVIRFVRRGRSPSAVLGLDALVRSGDSDEVIEFTRGQESEIPQALKWQVSRADEEFDAIVVEARRQTVDSARVANEAFPIVAPAEEVDRRVRRALQEAWVAKEKATFLLPPSRLAFDPADVIRVDHDGRFYDLRVAQVTDGEARAVEATRQDIAVYDLPPTVQRASGSRATALRRQTTLGDVEVAFIDVPILRDAQQAYRPLIAIGSSGSSDTSAVNMAVYRSLYPSEGFALVTAVVSRARMGTLGSALHSGPLHRLDLGNSIDLVLPWGTLTSISDLDLLSDGNALAIETTSGIWEILSAGVVELVADGRYRLSRLLRGRRGTEWAMAESVPAGARVVILDAAVSELPTSVEDIGVPWYWRVGPASKLVSNDSFQQFQYAPKGIGLEPFSGVHAVQPWRRARADGDLTISWLRRSRDLSADLWTSGEIALGEESEAYEVDIIVGGVVSRTLTTTSTEVIYTAAQQVADHGAILARGASLSIAIYQIAPIAGRGSPYSTTLYL